MRSSNDKKCNISTNIIKNVLNRKNTIDIIDLI